MLYEILITFFTLVLYQTFAKKQRWPLISNGLIMVRDKSIIFWEWVGSTLGWLLNIKEWFNYIERLVRRVWNFIINHIWENIKPFFDSIKEIGEPLWQILFSWGYFFVGFAQTHYIFFSYLGGGVITVVVGYFTYDWWIGLVGNWVFYVIILCLFGIYTSFPDTLSEMFPRTVEVLSSINKIAVFTHPKSGMTYTK